MIVTREHAPEWAKFTQRRTHPLADRATRQRVNKRFRAKGIPVRACSRCFAVKALTQFASNRNNADGRNAWCRKCSRTAKGQWRREHPEREREYRAKYRKEHREEHRAYGAWYRAEKPEKKRASEHRRRARKRSAPIEPHTTTDLLALWESADAYNCVFCYAPFEHVEHLVPLSRGGAEALGNKWPACEECNLSKGYADPYRWIAERFPALREQLEPFFDLYPLTTP